MFLYRLNDDYDPACLPVFDSVSFADAINLSTIPLVSFEMVEYRWKTEQSIAIVFRYDSNIYYFLSDKEYPTTAECRRMKLDAEYDMADHHCDYYAKPILARFLGRFQRRLHTRAALELITNNIVMDPTTVAYHEEFLRHLQQIKVDDLHDRHLLQKLTDETRAIVETEHRYRPGAAGFEEARQQFESFMQRAPFTIGQEPSDSVLTDHVAAITLGQGPLA
jgi:hypothetical protein